MFGPAHENNGSNGGFRAEAEVMLTVEQLHRCRDTQRDLDNFVQIVRMAVAADQENRRLTSEEAVRELSLDKGSTTKLGRLLAAAPEGCREGEVGPDFATGGLLPAYKGQFF